MAIRAAVARHVLQLTLRREFASASTPRLARDHKPGSALDWATQVLSLPRNDWGGTVVPSPPPSPSTSPSFSASRPKPRGRPAPARQVPERDGWAGEVSRAVANRPPPRSRRGWGPARIAPRDQPRDQLDTGPTRHQRASTREASQSEEQAGRVSHRRPGASTVALVSTEELLARLGNASQKLEGSTTTNVGPESGASIRSHEDRPRSEDGPSHTPDDTGPTLEDVAPTLLGDSSNSGRRDDKTGLFRVPKAKLVTSTGAEVPPWSRRELRPNPEITVKDILACPPRWAPNRILAYLKTTRLPVRVGPMHAHLDRLRQLIDAIVPPNWGTLSAYRQRALLTLWSHWLQLAARIHDLGGLPRMRGWEGREFAAERFDALFLAIVGGRVRPGKGEGWDKWRARFKVGEMTPPELVDEEFRQPSPAEEPPDSSSPPVRHTFGLKTREPECDDTKQKGTVTHYTPPTLYADSPVEKHVEYDAAYTRAMKMRGAALAAMRQKRAREALRAVSVAIAFMSTVEARPTEFQLQLIFTHLTEYIPFKEITKHLLEEEAGPMHDVAARLQNLLQPWVTGAPLVEGGPPVRSTVTRWDSDNHLPARGEGRRMYTQRKQLLLTVGDMIMTRIEGGAEPLTYRRWLEAAEDMLPHWHFMVARYEGLYRAAADGQPLRAPTIKEAHALHLLARYAIARLPRSGMRLPPGAEGTLADPMYCLRLLLGTEGARFFPRQSGALHSVRSRDVDERIVATAIRWARAAAQRSLLAPVLALVRLLTGDTDRALSRPGHGAGPPPIPLRLAIYLAGAASAPEDVPALLPLLEKVDVAGDAALAQAVDTAGWRLRADVRVGHLSAMRSGPHAVVVRVLMLARKADQMGLRPDGEEGEEKEGLEARTRIMFLRWGLPAMGEVGETDGSLLQARTQG
ncbi:hypothetical protein CC85DRAFT_284110 [Cutaneotrichosporon oleaginosum]|uniref:Uncharacterized protein n=1 Tax=Cutaneotrichosporon oleaginosum TaxID=879819 RepID=A0A0J0XRS1_9TREE|nr:uncharacterized protein CC85DRAFT_284110 [Cutaneotrichosporon oleaginosum]KLT43826.1 hypothetical protein CC85DRAFT_284110 [Cutaneotrichosporon oleaginosum]TXT06432.1 hypothetical protein COLE_05763 [Cutaneotrichosporon oleaginosum]